MRQYKNAFSIWHLFESWKPIPNFPNYEISDGGRIRNKAGELMTPHNHKSASGEYLSITLSNKGRKKRFLVHRLVAKQFCDRNSNWKVHVHHIDADKKNNRADNLKWVTPTENNEAREELPF